MGEPGLLSHQLIGSFKAGDEIWGEGSVKAGRSCRGPSAPIGWAQLHVTEVTEIFRILGDRIFQNLP